ncbi:STAS domain-containing protein [Shewanella seohaensis]|uniref:Lipid asymmetry maintenance protein MlaB n=1 Tax=Shewanella seohaensis TaxID=755175 RepID=A0ABV4VZF4_9GAMM
MAVQVERKANFLILTFSDELNIFTVREHWEVLMALRGEPVSQLLVDVSAVTDLDTAGIQLLAWFCHQLPVEESRQFLGGDNPVVSRLVTLFSPEAPSLAAWLGNQETQ